MLITSLQRSGSTKFCMDLAKKLDYTYYDEIFEIGVVNHKQAIHEITLDTIHPKTPAFIQTVDFSKAVFNNHEINFFTLEKTDIFISRQNVKDTVWAYAAYLLKYFKLVAPDANTPMLAMLTLRRDLPRFKFFYDYCIAYKKDIVIPDLTYTNTSVFRNNYVYFTDIIDQFGQTLELPPGLIFE